MTLSNEEILSAIDESIEKWQRVVYEKDYLFDSNCPICDLSEGDNCEYSFDVYCPIVEYTNQFHCRRTPFYHTSLWISKIAYSKKYSHIFDNRMLSFLYELRLWFRNNKMNLSRL